MAPEHYFRESWSEPRHFITCSFLDCENPPTQSITVQRELYGSRWIRWRRVIQLYWVSLLCQGDLQTNQYFTFVFNDWPLRAHTRFNSQQGLCDIVAINTAWTRSIICMSALTDIHFGIQWVCLLLHVYNAYKVTNSPIYVVCAWLFVFGMYKCGCKKTALYVPTSTNLNQQFLVPFLAKFRSTSLKVTTTTSEALKMMLSTISSFLGPTLGSGLFLCAASNTRSHWGRRRH